MSITNQHWLSEASDQLRRRFNERQPGYNPKLEARLLLCHVLDVSMTHLLSWPDKEIPQDRIAPLSDCLDRRLAGEPVAYILGTAEFWGLSFIVSPDVLVPRADTELIVESTLNIVSKSKLDAPRLMDMGTGSGAIAIALGSEIPNASVTALDKSSQALEIAEKNALNLGIENVCFLQSDWFEQLTSDAEAYDVIVTNPPYVAPSDPHLEDLIHEPDLALTSDDNGFADIQHIITHAKNFLKVGGWLLIEHGYEQAETIQKYFDQNGYTEIQTNPDLAGNDRMTMARYTQDGR